MRRSPLLGLLLALTLLAGACSSKKDPKPSELREKIATQVREIRPSLTVKQADCYAGLLVKELGAKTIDKIDLTDKAPDDLVAKGLATAAIAAADACGIGGSTSTSTTSTTAGATTTTEG